MSEFDIKIGTKLDTSEAESQLKSFIEKNSSGSPLDLKIGVMGEEKLTALESSLKSIKALSKDIGKINIDVGSSLGNINANLGAEINKGVSSLVNATQSATQQIGTSTKNAISHTIDSLEQGIEGTHKKIQTMMSNLESFKLNPFADSDGIDKMISTLKQIESTDLSKFGTLGLNLVNEELNNMVLKFKDIEAVAKNNQIQEAFNNVKINPLIEQMETVKQVLSAKNLDTSGVDILQNSLNSMKKDVTDFGSAMSKIKVIQNDFKNLKVALDITDVKTAETAIKNLQKYKNELNKKIAIETDSGNITKLNAELERTDKVIGELQSGLNSVGQSINKNLITTSNTKDLDNLANIVEKTVNHFETLKDKADKLRNTEFIDISKMSAVEECIQGINKSMSSLDMKNLNTINVNDLTNDVKTLENAIKSVETTSEKLKLEAKFDMNLEKVTQQLNGLNTALIKTGHDTSNLKELQAHLNSIVNMAKVDIGGATARLKEFSNGLNGIGKDLDLGNIKGDVSQFIALTKELEASYKKLANTSDVNFANAIEQQIDRTKNAITQLVSGFNEAQREYAEFTKSATSGNNFSGEIEQITAEVGKLKAVLSQLGNSDMFKGLTGAGGQLEKEFAQATAKARELEIALKNALDTNADASVVSKLRQELALAQEDVKALGNQAIDLNCENAIAELDKLKVNMEAIGQNTDEIDALRVKFESLADQVAKGSMSWKQASAEMQKCLNDSNILHTNMTKSSSAFDSMGGKVQGFFGAISDSFKEIGVGMLVSDAIVNSFSMIKDTVVDLDGALMSLARVLPDNVSATASNLQGIADTARDIAIEVGQSTENVIEGMATALQAGANTMEQATQIAQSSAIFQNITDMSAEKASQAVASLINQFYDMNSALSQVSSGAGSAVTDYNNLTEAMDLVNYAGNNFAISSQGVTDALQRGGSVLANYGLTLSDSIALIAGANESLQNPELVGNGLKTIAINLAGVKTSAKDGSIELNKTAQALKEIAGIDVFTDSSKTSVKDMMTIMDELKGKWDTLTDAQQKALSEGIAGKQQAQVFQALMSGWSRVKQFQDEIYSSYVEKSA